MTVQERQMTFAYSIALEIEHGMDRVIDFAWQSLSKEGQTALYTSQEAFRNVTREMSKFMHDHTDFEEKGESK